MFVDQPTNHVNLFQSELNGIVILGWTGRVRRPKLKQINEKNITRRRRSKKEKERQQIEEDAQLCLHQSVERKLT
ncbi:hypothetical protein V1478_007305 [Vespula squamosa]|uniref:Uncharacterized protein n=1 Tax=Vespula squamosa TaxID=30214 RepID=A0ABD2B2R5_VESSQ